MKRGLREKIYNKFNKRCAYCGVDLKYKDMQVDHYWPQFLKHFEPDKDNNRFENLMPSCRKCNIHKGGMKPETWRGELERQVDMLRKNAQFDRALRFDQIRTRERPIIFYFEYWRPK